MARPILICLHAITRGSSDFVEFADVVRDIFDILAPDLIGHGSAQRSASYTVRDYLDGVLPNLGDLDQETDVCIWGHSLGGLVAVALAQQLGGRVRSLFIEDAPLFETDWPRFKNGPFYAGFVELRQYLRRYQKTLDPQAFASEIGSWPSGNDKRSYLEHFGELGVRRRAEQLLAFDAGCLDDPIDGRVKRGFDIRDAIRNLQCPISLLAGNRRKGSALTAADIVHVQGLGRSVEVWEFADLGHDIRLFRPQDCRNLLMAASSH